MSIIIEGAEMPPSCYFCPMTNDGFYLCKANNPYRQLEDDCEERRPEWCPIVHVPEHGRLIDADALINDHPRTWTTYDLQRIATAPAIIPADPAEEVKES